VLIRPSRAGPRAGPSPLRAATQARDAAAGSLAPARGPRLAAPQPGPSGRGSGPPNPRFDLRVVRRARGPMGPRRRPPTAGCGGDGRGTCSSSPQASPGWPGAEGDMSLLSIAPSCARGATPQAHSYHPSWDKEVPSDKASPPASLCHRVTRPLEPRPT
jgi:hypothetical protein